MNTVTFKLVTNQFTRKPITNWFKKSCVNRVIVREVLSYCICIKNQSSSGYKVMVNILNLIIMTLKKHSLSGAFILD